MTDSKYKRRARRIQKAKKKSKGAKLFPENSLYGRKIADHLASCSCMMCGNPRRHYGNASAGMTIQELKAPSAKEYKKAA